MSIVLCNTVYIADIDVYYSW